MRAPSANAPLANAPFFNPYKTKKVWPPDYSKLSEVEQFRFERKYKRRVKLATATPRYDKFMRLAQFFSITGVLVYALLSAEWAIPGAGQSETYQPLQGLRDKFWGSMEMFVPEKRFERRKPE